MMQGPLKNLPNWPAAPDGVAVLSISPDERDHASLRGVFSHTRWRLFEAPDCSEALDFLRRNPVGVVICESRLPDGGWRDLLEGVSGLPTSPLLIVASRNADDALWAEALNLGAYDVLSKPFQMVEVTRIVSLAWLYWKEQMVSTERMAVGAEWDGAVRTRTATA